MHRTKNVWITTKKLTIKYVRCVNNFFTLLSTCTFFKISRSWIRVRYIKVIVLLRYNNTFTDCNTTCPQNNPIRTRVHIGCACPKRKTCTNNDVFLVTGLSWVEFMKSKKKNKTKKRRICNLYCLIPFSKRSEIY